MDFIKKWHLQNMLWSYNDLSWIELQISCKRKQENYQHGTISKRLSSFLQVVGTVLPINLSLSL